MKHVTSSLMLLLLAAFPCFAHHIAVVVDKGNTVVNINSAELSRICKGEMAAWPDGRPVVLVLHRVSADESRTLERLTKWSDFELQSFIRDHPKMIKIADSDAAIIETVEMTPGAIGFVETRSINDEVKVLRIDSKLPLEAGYLTH